MHTETMKILFQGDSLIDGFRDRSNYHDLGESYPYYAAAMLNDAFLDVEFEFINLGFGGSRTEHLVERLETDFIDIQPDIVSIGIGLNDVWHHYDLGVETTDEQFEANLRTVLSALKARTHARIVLVQPFLVEEVNPRLSILRPELTRKQEIFKALADEYADVYIPLEKCIYEKMTEEPTDYTQDGIHLTSDGACFIGEAYLGAVTPLVELLAQEDD